MDGIASYFPRGPSTEPPEPPFGLAFEPPPRLNYYGSGRGQQQLQGQGVQGVVLFAPPAASSHHSYGVPAFCTPLAQPSLPFSPQTIMMPTAGGPRYQEPTPPPPLSLPSTPTETTMILPPLRQGGGTTHRRNAERKRRHEESMPEQVKVVRTDRARGVSSSPPSSPIGITRGATIHDHNYLPWASERAPFASPEDIEASIPTHVNCQCIGERWRIIKRPPRTKNKYSRNKKEWLSPDGRLFMTLPSAKVHELHLATTQWRRFHPPTPPGISVLAAPPHPRVTQSLVTGRPANANGALAVLDAAGEAPEDPQASASQAATIAASQSTQPSTDGQQPVQQPRRGDAIEVAGASQPTEDRASAGQAATIAAPQSTQPSADGQQQPRRGVAIEEAQLLVALSRSQANNNDQDDQAPLPGNGVSGGDGMRPISYADATGQPTQPPQPSTRPASTGDANGSVRPHTARPPRAPRMAGQGDSGALAVTLEAAGEAPEDPQEETAAAVSAPSVDADANGELAVLEAAGAAPEDPQEETAVSAASVDADANGELAVLESAGEAPEDPQEETAAAVSVSAASVDADANGELAVLEAAGAAPEDTQEETAAALPAAARFGALAVADVEGEMEHTHLLNPLNDRRHFNPALFRDDADLGTDDVEYEVFKSIVLDGDEVRYAP